MLSNARWRLPLLLGLLLVRFGSDFVGQAVFVLSTYLLAYLYLYRAIPRRSFPEYNLTRLTLRAVAVAVPVGALMSGLLLAMWHFGFVAIGGGGPILSAASIASGYLLWFCMQLILNALPEELLFRGILWGEGRRVGLSDPSILCIQAILFWAGHYYYYDLPFNWINVLVSGLVYGFVAWRTKSVLASSIVHAIANTTGTFFGPSVP